MRTGPSSPRITALNQALARSPNRHEQVAPLMPWVMKETLRRFPPLPVISRVALRDFEWEGFRIPAGAMLVLSPIHTHHMREWWPDPERFDPDRFSPSRAEGVKHTHSWVPFGGGAQLCIGYRFAEVQVKSIGHQTFLALPAGGTEGHSAARDRLWEADAERARRVLACGREHLRVVIGCKILAAYVAGGGIRRRGCNRLATHGDLSPGSLPDNIRSLVLSSEADDQMLSLLDDLRSAVQAFTSELHKEILARESKS
jgi:hypothetical protein